MTRLLSLAPFALAAAVALGSAHLAASVIEGRSEREAAHALRTQGLDFARARADGLRLTLTGTAPSEAQRFRALTAAGRVVDPARVIDAMAVAGGAEVAAPRYAVEMLRGQDGLSLIGLVPEATDRAALARRLEAATGSPVSDFLETADHPVPDAWGRALDYALTAAESLPRSQISVDATRVAVTAAAESPEERRAIEAALARARPEGLALDLDVSAPRPVIAPFTLRFAIEGGSAALKACTAATPEGAAAIEDAARGAGAAAPACRLGLGAPSPRWPEAAAHAIAAVAELGGGTVTFADADVTLVAPPDAAPARFDEVAGALEGALPEAFSLHAVPPHEAAEEGAPAFAAHLDEGGVTLSGRLPHERARAAAESLARARFPGAEVQVSVRTAQGLPEGWPLRAMAGIEALALLEEGRVAVGEDGVALRGVTGDADAEARAAGLLSRALGGGEDLRLDIAYDPALDPDTDAPSPEECVARIQAAHAARKITFASGSDKIEPSGLATVGEIAAILSECPELEIEVAGHTDSQGREGMNLDLSRARAVAVVEALAARRAPVAGLTPAGYGEARPVEDNATEVGREANRRIEFTLARPDGASGEEAPAADPPQGPRKAAVARGGTGGVGLSVRPATAADARAAASPTGDEAGEPEAQR